MLNENIKAIRKSKGLSQEELAAKLNVVRQTISKWEKGYSIPDVEMLTKIADVLEVPVSQLLGKKIEIENKPDILAEQLGRIAEQLAIKNNRSNRIWKAVNWILITIVILILLLIILNFVSYSAFETVQSTIS